MVCQRGKAQRSQSCDSTALVLMPPLPPENALPHVENATMFQVVTLVEPKGIAVDCKGQAGPVDHGRECLPGVD